MKQQLNNDKTKSKYLFNVSNVYQLMDTQALMDNKGSTKKAGIEEEDQMAIYNFTMIGI